LISSAFFASPAFVISHAAADARTKKSSTCGSIDNLFLRCSLVSVGVRLEIQLPAPPIGYVGVQLGCRKIGMSQHFLNGSEVGSAFEEVRRERVAEEVRMDAVRLQAGLLGQLAEDQEGAGAGQRAAAGVQEELGSAPHVEERPAA
jgi:hypothetical protein